ncbi:MAG: rhomboid family serine protease [Candidatus Ozemobacter sibiricus]|jgi:membrane associated rhomboid family serine protease|uniref:Rhomboid family serine protease n=1 Tax=Candidatus Ozemobacter sibiricus TaxID=2268124 RepID=A0A367ZU77_9BACT|nr:MAG: rhomboid family serine protease [Candidatus Ozemobacter sibiricus]
MFLPLHDQNNEPVQTLPVVSYTIMALTFLIFCYQFLIQLGDAEEAMRFSLAHGMVPGPFLAGKTQYEHVIRLDGPQRSPRRRSKPLPLPSESDREGSPAFHEIRITVENSRLGIWLMPITYNFLHGGWMHLLGNLWFFWIFSDNVEERMGRLIFLAFYLVTGMAGGLLHTLLHSDSTMPLVGASGAISGLMGAYIVLFPGNRITSYFCPIWFFIRRIDVPSWMVLGFYLLFNVVAMSQTMFAASHVAFDCHVGGFAAGILGAWLFRRPPAPSPAPARA